MKIKKPSIRGMKNVEYLGRFIKDKFIQEGHNNYSEEVLRQLIKQGADPKTGIREDEIYRAKRAAYEKGRGHDEDTYEAAKSVGRATNEQAEAASEAREARQRKSDSGSRSSGKYDWETTVVNGKRQHRLIRR